MRRLLAVAIVLFLALPAVGACGIGTGERRGEVQPAAEWTLHDWVPIHLGPIDLSINKAVAYLCSARCSRA